MKSSKIRRIGIYLNPEKRAAKLLAGKCAAYLSSKKIDVAFLKNQVDPEMEKNNTIYDRDDFFNKPDCLIVLGGDGTILWVAREAARRNMPLFGINLGKLGFLTEGEARQYKTLLDELVRGAYYVEKRMMLSCSILRENKAIKTHLALNDVLIKNAGYRMMTITACSNDDVIDQFRADGLIVSSPTGSTAYSLAAGGPVVAPGTDIMIVNPVCPHRLHDRAYVIPAEKQVFSAQFDPEEKDIIVSIDGQKMMPIRSDDQVVVKKADVYAKLLRLNAASFYDRLRNKLTEDFSITPQV